MATGCHGRIQPAKKLDLIPDIDLMPMLQDREFKKILLIKPSSLGDVIHALPVLHGLRQRYPQSHIAWLLARPFVPLLEGHPDLDEIIEFDRKRLGRVGRSLTATREFVGFVQMLRGKRFDLVVDLQGLFRSGFFCRASGASTRVGFAEAREMAWMFYTHKLPRSEHLVHAVDRNYLAANALGFGEIPKSFNLPISADVLAEARRLLGEAGLADGERFVAVLPGTRWETKLWPPESFSALIDRLIEEAGVPVVLMGAPDETELCGRIASGCRRKPHNVSGKTSLKQLVAAISLADLVVCHDSGPMHIGAALGRPMVAILGPTEPKRTGPYGSMESVVRLELQCSPCFLRKLSQCRHDHRCMRDLSVADLWPHIQTRLQSR